MTTYLKGEKNFSQPGDLPPYTCHSKREGPTPKAQFEFAPVWTGKITPESGKDSFEGNCFANASFEMKYDASNPSTFQVVATMANPRNWTCMDTYLFGNTEVQHVELFKFAGTHTFTFDVPSKISQDDLVANGIDTYLFCEGLTDEILSVYTTLKAFVGGLGTKGKIPFFEPKVPKYMEDANVEFMRWATKYDLVERKTKKVEIDDTKIKSGDYFAVMRLDGLDPMIMYGTGSHSGHTVMAHRFNGELHIVESQDAWYWPVHRIQRTPFKQWMQWAEECDFHVVYMPLSEKMRAAYNETAATEFFNTVQGLPYGYHNFLYGWVDTPFDNWPRLLPRDLVPVAFSIIERYDKNLTDTFFTQSLNKKLNVTGYNISQIADEATKHKMQVSDVMAIVEEDGWKYDGQWHDGESMVCSSFVTAMWKAAGIFGDNYVNAVEWGPKDVYQVDIFNKQYDTERPQ